MQLVTTMRDTTYTRAADREREAGKQAYEAAMDDARGAWAEHVREEVLTAAADALDGHTSDSTGSARYNRRRAFDAAFNAAMARLREVPVEDRPDGLVAEVDELCALLRERDHTRETVARILREAARKAPGSVSTEPCTAEAVTIFHTDWSGTEEEAREASMLQHAVGYGDEDLTREAFAEHYVPAETVLGTTDLEEAFHHAQGHVVNQEQGGRHMVPSASVGHVFMVHHGDGSHSFHVCKGVGFEEVDL